MKVLIIRFSSIGDIVLTTPVVRCLKRQVPGVVVHYLTKKQFAPLLTTNIYIDKVIGLDDSLGDTIKVLQAEGYDHVIDLHNNLRTLRVKTMLRRPSASFAKLNLKKWLLVNTKVDCMPKVHIVDRYMATVRKLGVKYDGMGMDYFIPVNTNVYVTQWPELFAKGYIAYAIGGQHTTKKMPNHKIAEVLQALNYPVVLLGGKEDRENGDTILKLAPSCPAINLCGELSLHQSAWVAKNAKGLISHDTGMMHIAAALDVPILSIWGNTVPQLGMYPFYKDGSMAALKAEMFEVLGLKCRPCSKIGFDKCPKGHFDCMEAQNSAGIAKSALALTVER